MAEVGTAEGHEPPAAVEEVIEDTAFDQLSDREVALAVEGGRDFEVVSAFGSLRYEGCTVLVVEEELGEAGRRLAESLRKRAEKIRRVRGIDVFVFRDRTVMESTYEAKAWQGTFVALPKPNVVLCARSDGYLEELLARTMNDQVHGRALPRELPEWNYVDTSSAMWAIRHIPTESPGQVVSGLAWSLNPKGRSLLEVVYLAKNDAGAEAVAGIWAQPALGSDPTIMEEREGTTVVRFDLEKAPASFWSCLCLYWTLGETGVPRR